MKRDLAIDAARGLAIWSMVTAHFALGSRIAEPTHSFPYVDGMSAFVLLSGVVLGLVHHRWIERHSLGYSYWRLTKRLAVLYLCQLSIALVAVAAAFAGHRWLTLLRPVRDWPDGIWRSITMSYLPSGGNILLLYLVLMASAYALFPILRAGRWRLVIGASVGLYLVSQVCPPDWFYLTADMTAPRIQNWAAWQILFIPALVVGWNWDRWRIAERIDAYLPWLVLAALGVGVGFHLVIDTGPLAASEPWFADKLDFRPARAIGAWVAIPAVYGVLRFVLARIDDAWLRPLLMTGARSIDSYVIQAIALVIVPIHLVHRPWSEADMIIAVAMVFGTCWVWAEFREAFGIDKLHRLPILVADAMTRRRSPSAASTA